MHDVVIRHVRLRGAATLPADWRIASRRDEPTPKREILWQHKSRPKFNSFVVAPNMLLIAGQLTSPDGTASFLAAVSIEDGSEIWRQPLPAAVVKGGLAVDDEARILVSLRDGRVVCFAGAE